VGSAPPRRRWGDGSQGVWQPGCRAAVKGDSVGGALLTEVRGRQPRRGAALGGRGVGGAADGGHRRRPELGRSRRRAGGGCDIRDTAPPLGAVACGLIGREGGGRQPGRGLCTTRRWTWRRASRGLAGSVSSTRRRRRAPLPTEGAGAKEVAVRIEEDSVCGRCCPRSYWQ
jgi:hypothetical protein